jgi:uncharacterized protein involved in response to NO
MPVASLPGPKREIGMHAQLATAGDAPAATRPARPPAAFLENGFRPFFLGAAAWAVISLVHWLAMLAGIAAGTSAFDPLAWHQHEMVFGYGGAVVAGFLLTAVPNWTGRPVVGARLLVLLFAAWIGARLANLASGSIGWLPALVLDAGLLWALVALGARELIAAGNRRNLPVLGILAAFAAAATWSHAATAAAMDGRPARHAGIAVLLVLIALIGGRIVPTFTGNWLRQRGVGNAPAAFGTLDKAAIGVLVAALLVWLVAPGTSAAAALLVLAGVLHFVRLARWSGWRTTAEPLVLILHVGYAWLAAGALLLGLSQLSGILSETTALHALTAGAIATMTLAVMTRATLGHTGRPLHAGPATAAIYLLVTVGALLRLLAPALPLPYTDALALAAALWSGSFLLYLGVYGPMLVRPRVDATRP